MDWSRIKTILIAVLLVTNVFLGATYIQGKMAFEQSKRDQLDRVMALLAQNNVEVLDTDLDFPDVLESINVAYAEYDEEMVKKFLGENYQLEDDVYIKGSASVALSEMALEFSLRPLPSSVLDDGLPFEDVLDSIAIEKALKETQDDLGLAKDYQIERMFRRDGYDVVVAGQVYEDLIMDDGLLTAVYYHGNLVYYKRSWLTIQTDNSANKYDIISLDRALYLTMPKLRSGDDIEDISISYKLNDSGSVVSNLISGEALPFYSIRVSGDKTYYVRAIVEN